MVGLAPLDFSLVIAFLLPGFVSLYALSVVSPRISGLMNTLAGKDASLGTSVAVLLAALAAGVMMSGMRALVIDWLQHNTGVRRPDLNYRALTDRAVLGAFKEAVANVYRFSQFYGNMFVALLLLTILKFGLDLSSICAQPALFALSLAGTVVLFLSHRRSLSQTYSRMTEILTPSGKEAPKP